MIIFTRYTNTFKYNLPIFTVDKGFKMELNPDLEKQIVNDGNAEYV